MENTLVLERQMRDFVHRVMREHGADEQAATEIADDYADKLRHFQVGSIMRAGWLLRQKKSAA